MCRALPGVTRWIPFHYLHLQDGGIDIRGSQIDVFCQYDFDRHKASFLCVSLQDGRWSRLVEEPLRRVQESLQHRPRSGEIHDPFGVHVVYLTSILRWWNNTLDSFNDQLISHVRVLLPLLVRVLTSSRIQEKSLQSQMDDHEAMASNLNNDVNKALHTMTAHLHRYGSELGWLEDIVKDIIRHRRTFIATLKECGVDPIKQLDDLPRISFALEQITSQLRTVSSRRRELERKTQNILALMRPLSDISLMHIPQANTHPGKKRRG
jgi:hypothetical protein